MDAKKIIRIKSEHPEMTDDIIKRIPEIIEKPIVITESMTVNGRITVMGDVFSKDNKPILVALELNPQNSKGMYINDIRVASSYKRNNPQYLLDNSKMLWIEQDKKRTSKWLRRTRVQFPVGLNKTGLINKILLQKVSFVNNNVRKNGKKDTQNKKYSLSLTILKIWSIIKLKKSCMVLLHKKGMYLTGYVLF